MKPITLDALLMLSEQDIRDLFPCGGVSVGKKWKPAETEKQAEKTLARLLRDKRARQEKPRYLRQSSSVPKPLLDKHGRVKPVKPEDVRPGEGNYTTNPKAAVGVDKHGRGEPEEALPPDIQEEFTKRARERFDSEHQEQIDRATVRSVLAGLRQIGIDAAKSGADPRLAIALAATKMLETEQEAA